MPVNVPNQSLVERLSAELASTFDPRATGPLPGGEGVLRCFDRFGAHTQAAGIPLADTLAAAMQALADLQARFGGPVTESERQRSYGVALAAVAEAFDRGQDAIELQELAENTDHFPDTQHERLTALHRINRAATSNLHSNQMLDIVAETVKDSTHSDASAIFLYDETSGLLTLGATRGLNPKAVGNSTLRLGEGIVGRAAIEGQIIAAPNAAAHESYLPNTAFGDAPYASQVSVPILLRAQNRLIGVLNIHSLKPRVYDDDELEFMRTVAGELAISIVNAHTLVQTDERLHQKIEELGTLQRITRTLASTLDLELVLRIITQNALEIANAEAAAIFRPGRSNSQHPWTPMIESRTGSFRTLKDVHQRDSIIEQVFQDGTAVQATLDYDDGPADLYCMPLRTPRTMIGAICYRLDPGAVISADAMALLQAFSDSAAMAIENAELYAEAIAGEQTQRTLVQEMHHRVRNNLQTVAALLSLQIRRADHEPWSVEIREAVSRIQAIAAVHDLLSDPSRFTGATLDQIARLVAEDAHSTLIPSTLRVTFDIEKTDLRIPSRQATIMSLLLNELTANAISHGFEDRDKGYVRIRAWEDDGIANVEIFNDGEKVPEGFDPSQSQGLGMRITHRLVTSDLHGTFSITSDKDGTTALITFPIAAEARL